MSETAIVKSILDWAYFQPDLLLERMQSGNLTKSYKQKKTGVTKHYRIRMAKKGSADIWGCVRDLNGMARAVFIECKMPHETIEEGSDQKRFMERVITLGAIHIIANSIDDVVIALKPYRRAIQ